jgi:outer membrane protein assembly factor BamB
VTQKILWQHNVYAPIRSAPIIGNGKVYVVASNNKTFEFNAEDGTESWTHAGIQETASFLGMASPLATDDLVIVPYNSGEVFALRRINGRMVWEDNLASTERSSTLPALADIQAQPILDQDRVFITSHSGRFVSFDVRTGRRVWDVGSVQTPWLAGSVLYVVTTENQLTALNRDDGRVFWAVNLERYADPDDHTDQILWVGPIVAGGKAWLANSVGQLVGFSPEDGKKLDVLSVGGSVYIAPIIADKTLLIVRDDGVLTAWR